MTGEEFLRLLVRAQIRMWDSADTALRGGHDLPLGSYLPMRVIADTPGCRIQDIAASLAITDSGASQAVDRLEKTGRARRRPNPADRRSTMVELTDEGFELLGHAAATLDQEIASRLAALPEEAREQLANGLTRLSGTD